MGSWCGRAILGLLVLAANVLGQEGERKRVLIEHSFDSGASWVSHVEVKFAPTENIAGAKLELTKEVQSTLHELLRAKGFVQVRARTDPERKDWVLTTFEACSLVQEGFEESFNVHFVKNDLVSISFKKRVDCSATADLSKEGRSTLIVRASKTEGGVVAKTPVQMTEQHAKTQAGKSQTQKNPDGTERSFFQKYGFYIVIGFFILSMRAFQPQQASESGSSINAAQTAVSAQGAPAASSSSTRSGGSQKKKRSQARK